MGPDDQTIHFRFALTLLHYYPDMYDELMQMSLKEVADKVNELEGVNLKTGTSFTEVAHITETIIRNHLQIRIL